MKVRSLQGRRANLDEHLALAGSPAAHGDVILLLLGGGDGVDGGGVAEGLVLAHEGGGRALGNLG